MNEMRCLVKNAQKLILLAAIPVALFALIVWIRHVQTSTLQYCYRQIVQAMHNNDEEQLSYFTTLKAKKLVAERIDENSTYTDTCYDGFTHAQKSRAFALWLDKYPPTWQHISPTQAKAYFAYGAQEVFEFRHTDDGWKLTDIEVRNGTPPCGWAQGFP